MASVTKSFSIDPERDRDVLEWIDNLPDYRGALSEAIIGAIRCEIRAQKGDPGEAGMLGLVLKKLDQIQAALGGQPAPRTDPELPEDVLGALDDLAG